MPLPIKTNTMVEHSFSIGLLQCTWLHVNSAPIGAVARRRSYRPEPRGERVRHVGFVYEYHIWGSGGSVPIPVCKNLP